MISNIESFISRFGHSPEVNTTKAESFCVWCQAENGEVHSLACPEGERYKYFQRLGESGISIPAYMGYVGGLVKSEAKSKSSRANGRKGGRPKSTQSKSIDIGDI